MSNFKDKAITKARAVADKAKDKALDKAKSTLSSQIDKVKSKATETLAKSVTNLESKLKDGVSNVSTMLSSGATEMISGAAADAASVVIGELATGSQNTPFAKPAFLGKALDVVGVKDVYGLDNAGVLNLAEIPNVLANKKLTDAAKGLGGLKDSLSSIVKNKDGSFGLNAKALTDRVKDVLGGSQGALSKLGDSVKSGLSAAVGGAVGGLMSKFEGKIGDVVQNFSTVNVSDAKGLFNSINQLTKNSSLAQMFDVGAESQLLTGLFKEAIDLKMPAAIETLVTNAGSSTAAMAALKNVAQHALLSGSVNVVGKLTEQLGANQILALAPQATSQLLANYKLDKPAKQSELPALSAEFLGVLSALDPAWHQASRGGESVSNLQSFSHMSADARRVLEASGQFETELLIAGQYPTQSMKESIGEMYPLSPVGANYA